MMPHPCQSRQPHSRQSHLIVSSGTAISYSFHPDARTNLNNLAAKYRLNITYTYAGPFGVLHNCYWVIGVKSAAFGISELIFTSEILFAF
jgi:hypothetical protein